MFEILANIFGYLLNFIYQIVDNYGLAIIIFSVTIKILMIPMHIRQQKSLEKNKIIQQKSKDIQEKYKDEPEKQTQELINLYKTEKMNPLSGCLSAIIQIVVVISMFYLVSSPLTYMKHVDSNLLNTYKESIETKSYQEIAIIKQYSNTDENVKLNMNFLGLDLSDIPTQNLIDWKVYILPVLYIITSLLLAKTNEISTKETKRTENNEKIINEENEIGLVPTKTKEENMEDAMKNATKQMTYLMPIMTVGIAFVAPLGLALYWLVNNVLNIIEKIVIYILLNKKGIVIMINVLKFISRGIIRTILYINLKIFFGMKSIGNENIPKDEPLIFCGNHKSFFDPIAIVLTARRKMRFVAKEELKRNILTRYVCWAFECIYVKRDSKDIESIKQCLKTLKSGECLGIFPEGTRNGFEKNNGEIKNGAGYLALKTGTKIVPIGIVGKTKLFSKNIVIYGKPFDLSEYKQSNLSKDEVENLANNRIKDEIFNLLNYKTHEKEKIYNE